MLRVRRGEPCHVVTWPNGSAEDVVLFLAYAGVEETRDLARPPKCALCTFTGGEKACGSNPTWSGCNDSEPLCRWIPSFQRSVALLPPVIVEVACPDLADPYSGGPYNGCHCGCDGTGTREIKVAADRYLLVLCAWGAGREALPVWEDRDLSRRVLEAERDEGPNHGVVWHDESPRKALDATERWLICPCPERKAAVEQLAGPRFMGDMSEDWWKGCLALIYGLPGQLQNIAPRAIQGAEDLTHTAHEACQRAARQAAGW